MSSAREKLAHLWQLPLLLLSLLLFSLSGYLFVNNSPGLTLRRRIEIARQYLDRDRPQASLEALNNLLTSEKLAQENEANVRLLIGQALEAGQRQLRINIPANHLRIIEQTKLALNLGVRPTWEIHRRLGDSYRALDRAGDAVAEYRQAMSLDPNRGLSMRRRIIEAQAWQGDSTAALNSIEEFLNDKTLANTERAWALGEKGQLLADHGDFTGAQTAIADAVRLDSDPMGQAQSNYRLAYVAWKLGKGEQAERLAKLARDQFRGQHPMDADVAYLLGRIYQERTDLPAAIAAYQVVITKHADSRVAGSARLGRSVCRLTFGDDSAGLAELRGVCDELRGRDENSPLREQALAACRAAEQALAARSNYVGAIDVMGILVSLQPSQPASHYERLASLYEKRFQQVEQTIADASGAEKLRREQLAREALLGSADAALAAARAMPVGDAGYARTFWSAIDRYTKAEAGAQAVAAMELLVADRADDPLAAEALFRLGTDGARPDRAIGYLTQLRSRFASSPFAAQAGLPLARAYLSLVPADNARAEQVLGGIVKAAPPEDASEPMLDALAELAKLHHRTGRFDQAISESQELLKRAPAGSHAGSALFLSADSCRRIALRIHAAVASADGGGGELAQSIATRKQRLTEARAGFEKVIEFRRTNPAGAAEPQRQEKLSWFYRADCVCELAAYDEAIRLYDEAAARYQDDPAALAAYVQIVNSLCALGKMDEARQANEKAKGLLHRLPSEAFAEGGFTMPRAYWEQWLKWTSTAGAW